MIYRCSGLALKSYHEHHESAVYNDLSAACENGKKVDCEVVLNLTGQEQVKRSNGRSDLFKCAPDGRGIFVIVPMRGDESMISDYLAADADQRRFLREKVLEYEPEILTLEIIEQACSNSVEYMTSEELEGYAIEALKLGVMVKYTKSKKRIVAFLKGRSIDTDKDAIFALASWYNDYIVESEYGDM
jgi:hypothetical protein